MSLIGENEEETGGEMENMIEEETTVGAHAHRQVARMHQGTIGSKAERKKLVMEDGVKRSVLLGDPRKPCHPSRV